MIAPAVDAKQRENYLAAARDFFEEVTAETSRARAAADRTARRAGVTDVQVREWDSQAAHSIFPRGFPRA